jgi:small subunit ribosomal protein S15
MTEHLKLHPKDYASRRGLLAMVSRRRRLLDYVKETNPQMYLDLLRRLEIRK